MSGSSARRYRRGPAIDALDAHLAVQAGAGRDRLDPMSEEDASARRLAPIAERLRRQAALRGRRGPSRCARRPPTAPSRALLEQDERRVRKSSPKVISGRATAMRTETRRPSRRVSRSRTVLAACHSSAGLTAASRSWCVRTAGAGSQLSRSRSPAIPTVSCTRSLGSPDERSADAHRAVSRAARRP